MGLPVISVAQMRQWEKATWDSGQSESDVISRVGCAVARRALGLTRPGDLILILAGKGHNGDDARGACKHLVDRRVELLAAKDPVKDLPELSRMLALRPALVVDGLFGIGINRPLDAGWIAFVEQVNGAGLPVLAVDCPSGLNADTGEPQGTALRATITITVGAPKKGLLEPPAWPHVGRLEVADDVGLVPCPIESEVYWTLPEDFTGFPPARPVASHKGTFGHLALICGSLGYHGAAVLAARGAQRAQPGLISLYTQPAVHTAVAAQLQAVMVHPWRTELELPEKCSAVFVGPGLAAPDVPDEIKRRTDRLWRELEMPMIVDASALAWLTATASLKAGVRVITPHPGEAARLLGGRSSQVQADRVGSLRELSRRFGGCWVVLKGHETLVGRSSGAVYVNSSGNPHLAQGGAGDLFGGYVAGLLAQPMLQEDVCRTIRFAVWEHGAAADRLQARRLGWTVEDLARELGAVPPNGFRVSIHR